MLNVLATNSSTTSSPTTGAGSKSRMFLARPLPVTRPANTGDQVHHLRASRFTFQRALDPFDLTTDAADTRQQVLLIVDGVRHLS